MIAPQHLHILLIDGDPRLVKALSEGLSERGHSVVAAETLKDGLRLLKRAAFDVLLIDRKPNSGGILEAAGQWVHRPAVVLIAADVRTAAAEGDLDASQLAIIPELEERLLAAVRRLRTSLVDHFSFGPYQLNISKRRLYCDRTEVRITRNEYLLLRILAMNRGEVVSRRQLMQAVWGTATMGHGALDRLVNTVREKLKDFQPARISQALGSGYMLLEETTAQKQGGPERLRKPQVKSPVS